MTCTNECPCSGGEESENRGQTGPTEHRSWREIEGVSEGLRSLV